MPCFVVSTTQPAACELGANGVGGGVVLRRSGSVEGRDLGLDIVGNLGGGDEHEADSFRHRLHRGDVGGGGGQVVGVELGVRRW